MRAVEMAPGVYVNVADDVDDETVEKMKATYAPKVRTKVATPEETKSAAEPETAAPRKAKR